MPQAKKTAKKPIKVGGTLTTLNFPREGVAAWADLTLRQLDHLHYSGVAVPDVGNERKRYSLTEARIVVILSRMMAAGIAPRFLAEPAKQLRDFSQRNHDDFNDACKGLKQLYAVVCRGHTYIQPEPKPKVQSYFWITIDITQTFRDRPLF